MNLEWLDTDTAALLVAAGLLLWAGWRLLRQRAAPPREGTGLSRHLLGSPIPARPPLPAPERLVLQRRTPPTLPAAMLTITPQPWPESESDRSTATPSPVSPAARLTGHAQAPSLKPTNPSCVASTG